MEAVGKVGVPLTATGVFWARVTMAGSAVLILSPCLISF